jgi:hypothetical protein
VYRDGGLRLDLFLQCGEGGGGGRAVELELVLLPSVCDCELHKESALDVKHVRWVLDGAMNAACTRSALCPSI